MVMFRPYLASYDQPMTTSFLKRIASAPISWGICEVPGWGAMLPTKRVLSEMTSLGLPATELGAPGFFSDDSAELKDQLAEFNMSMIGGFTPVVLHDKSQEKATIEMALNTSKKFQEIGATHFVSCPVQTWDWANPEELSKDEVTQFFKMLAEVDQICKDHGLVQVVHPHLQTVVETKKDIDMVVDNSDVMWCLDTGHMTIGGQDTVEFAKKYASRVGHVHLKDVNMKSVPPVLARQQSIMEGVQKGLFTPLGQGDVPILETILALESAGYQGWYVIEQDVAITGDMPGLGEGPISGMKQSVDYLHNVVAPALAKIGK
jgi:inosose dehydratase